MAGIVRSRINLGRRTQQQTDTRDDNGGVSRQGFMNYASCGLKFAKLGEVGSYQDWNILPWSIGTKNHPEVAAGSMHIGDPDYVLDVMVHTRVGPGNGDYVCLKKNFNKPCPMCERAEELWKNEDTKDDARKLFAKRKCVYLVQELDENFHAKSETPLIFETAHSTFSKELQSRATSCLRGKGVVNFADPNDEGKVVSFSVNEGTMGNGKKFKEAGNFEFNERVEEISDEILEKCPSLDSMLIVKTYDQLKSALYGDPDDVENDFENQPDEEEQTNSTRSRNNNPPARFADEPQDENPSPRRRAAAEPQEDTPAPRRRAAPVDNDAEGAPAPRRRNAAPAADEAAEENGYETARRTSRRATTAEDAPRAKTRAPAENPNAMPFDDEQPDEAPEETPKATRGDAENECPHNYVFGRDCDKMPMCSRCDDNTWSKCSECKRKMKK